MIVADQSTSGNASKILFHKDGIAPGEPSTFAGYEGAGGVNVAATPTIFSAKFPVSGWKVYNPAHLNNGTDAVYWIGKLTTVDNPIYGVKGGERIKVAVFRARQNLPTAVIPSGGKLAEFISDGSLIRAGSFGEIYRFANVNQQKALVPILKDFIAG